MKTYLYASSLLFLTILTMVGCSKDDDSKPGLTQTPSEQVTEQEISGLVFMREEEKLARDVYSFFSNLYGEQIFMNITVSEQSHMDTVLALLNKYNVDDPASNVVGVFNDTLLQTLYNDLTAKGSASVLEAYKVGAMIEELDIRDLNKYLSETDEVDIIAVYEFLNCGSRNHLRSFNMKINKSGETYTAEFLSQSEYDEIANSEKEKCGNQ